MFLLTGCSGSPTDLGVNEGKLKSCSGRPNCISSQSQGSKHYEPPLTYEGLLGTANTALINAVGAMPYSRIVIYDYNYIHAEFSSDWFGFVDDVEFYFDDVHKTIHLRSASRVGYSDFGVNRRRMMKIRTRYYQELERLEADK
ncbi:MAG: DUF1499 domain-containing protein [Planctomycetes bacterium]|nr:DUF1499 domain-containing protein [Planctomycetota bacterium]